jgi:hypothetical protein
VRRSLLLTVVAAGVAVAAAGCGGVAGGTASPATNTSTAAATTSTTLSFDPCAVLPADGLAKLGVTGQAKIDPDSGACTWLGTFDISTHLLPYPLGQRPKKASKPTITPLTIGGHKAEFWRSDVEGWCSMELGLGAAQSFDIAVVAPDSKSMDTGCAAVKELATAAEPKLPTP